LAKAYSLTNEPRLNENRESLTKKLHATDGSKTMAKQIRGCGLAKKRAGYDFQAVFLSTPHERIAAIKQGVPAVHLNVLAECMSTSKEFLVNMLGLPRTTLNRKIGEQQPLSLAESERVLGLASLIGQAQNMVLESGNTTDFDAAQWLSGWLVSPLPALGNTKPAAYMDTVEGQKLMSHILAVAQSGAYA
jgi:putative toxin-antitoxin system antitoxin component (TIGR02293 family)